MTRGGANGLHARSKNVALVDDDPDLAEIVERSLQGTDWLLTCFLDAEEALAHLQQGGLPDVLLVDNRMPRIDGVDFLEQLAPSAGGRLPRAYLCSSVPPMTDVLNRVDRLGARFLLKDAFYDKTALLKALEQGSAT